MLLFITLYELTFIVLLWIVTGLFIQFIIRLSTGSRIWGDAPSYFWSAVIGGGFLIVIIIVAGTINLWENYKQDELFNKDKSYDK